MFIFYFTHQNDQQRMLLPLSGFAGLALFAVDEL